MLRTELEYRSSEFVTLFASLPSSLVATFCCERGKVLLEFTDAKSIGSPDDVPSATDLGEIQKIRFRAISNSN